MHSEYPAMFWCPPFARRSSLEQPWDSRTVYFGVLLAAPTMDVDSGSRAFLVKGGIILHLIGTVSAAFLVSAASLCSGNVLYRTFRML